MVGLHNMRAGGNTRDRLYTMNKFAIKGLSEKESMFYEWYLRVSFWLKLMMFERLFWLYERIFGFMKYEN